ncbi:MAG: ATP-binding protein [Bacilli bacterium]|nr:ATP-binding protein [Bacilli bacterium]
MEVTLLKMQVGGIKNIEKDIVLLFDTPNRTKTKGHGLIKAIYGPNGVGKTAIVLAADFYARLTKDETSLDDTPTMAILSQLINARRKEFFIEMSYRFVSDEKSTPVYVTHSISIGHDSFGAMRILSERVVETDRKGKQKWMLQRDADGLKGEDGAMSFLKKNQADLSKHSMVGSFPASLSFTKEDSQAFIRAWRPLFIVLTCATRLRTFYGEASDSHESFALQKLLDFIANEKSTDEAEYRATLTKWLTKRQRVLLSKHFYKDCFEVIDKEEKKSFDAAIPNLSRFLKIMKPDLEKIAPVYKSNGSNIIVDLEFHYQGGYTVSYEFESTGIKKLSRLYFALHAASKGSVAFIDEIDSDIHDVYIEKLVEYFLLNTTAQIILTTHNVGIMDSLNEYSNTIDFLTPQGHIVTWAIGGRRKPQKTYLKGYISGIPFNLSDYQFAEVFA